MSIAGRIKRLETDTENLCLIDKILSFPGLPPEYIASLKEEKKKSPLIALDRVIELLPSLFKQAVLEAIRERFGEE